MPVHCSLDRIGAKWAPPSGSLIERNALRNGIACSSLCAAQSMLDPGLRRFMEVIRFRCLVTIDFEIEQFYAN